MHKRVYNRRMSIISNPKNMFLKNHFVFIGDDLLLKKGAHQFPLTVDDLPDEKILQRCLDSHVVADWYAETELDYSAMMLERDCPVPAGTEAIPLRQFFWDARESDGLVGLSCRAHGFLRLRSEYRFCPTCGKALVDDGKFAARKCTGCGKLIFPRIEPAVIVLVSKGEKILLAVNKNYKTKRYSCIAGFVEHGETVEECVRREVLEETGLCVKNICYRGSQPWPFPDQLMLAFTAEWESGEIKIQEEELLSAQWYDRNNLPDNISPKGSAAYNLIFGCFK